MFVQGLAAPARAWDELIPGSRYISARAAAMSNAFLPLGDDGAAALFYNPAVVGRIRATQAEPLNLALTANGGFTDTLGLNSYKVFTLSDNAARLNAAPNTFQGMAGQLVSTFYGKGFAIGLLASDDFAATSDPAGNIRYRTRYQLIPAAAGGVRLAGGIVRLGYSVQWVNVALGDQSVPAGASPLGYNELLAQGSGLSHMFGAALTLPVAYLPQLDLVVRNIGNTVFNGPSLIGFASNSSGAPATVPMTMDASLSIQPKLDAGIVANLVAQLRDMTNRTGLSYFSRLCGGLELSIKDYVLLRGGWGQGYPSLGVGFKFKKGEFNLSWFDEEIGSSYKSQRDIRFMFQYQMRAF